MQGIGLPPWCHSYLFEQLLAGRRGDRVPARKTSLGLLTDPPEAGGLKD